MDCLICVKPFIPEKEFGNYQRNPELCATAFSKLFQISRNPDVQGVLEGLVICVGCHRKLEDVMELVAQFEELQRKIDEKRIAIKNEMVSSKEISQAMAENFGANRMSKSSEDRLTLLKAFETGNTLPPAPDHDGIDAENSDESSEKEQDRATDDSNKSEDSVGSANVREILPAGARMLKNVKICLERVKIPPRVSTVHQEVISINHIPSNSKGGYALRNQKSATTQMIEESGSERESGDADGSSSEDYSEGAGCSKRSSDFVQGISNQPTRARGSIIKEFDHLKNGSFRCKHCSKIITKKVSLWAHLLRHGPRRFRCSIQGCEKRFYLKVNRDHHVKSVHERRRDFKCSRCSKMFSTLQIRNSHLKTVHDGIREFKCNWARCGKRFTQRGSMNIHIKIVHECRKDFKCGVEGCGMAFGIKQELQKHMSRKHKKTALAKKKRVVVTPRSISPPAHVKPDLKVEIFECRVTPSCRSVYAFETERDAHEETHANH